MSDNGFDSGIAVVGMAGRFPGARNIGEYWSNLRNGTESITAFSDAELLANGVSAAQLQDPNYVRSGAVLPDMEMFDAQFFGFSQREASIMDPQHRHFLECAWEALENAGHVPDRFVGSIGVFGGSGHNAYMPYNLLTNPKLVSSVGFFLLRHTGNDKDFLTTRVSYLLNLKGPSVNVQTACSTSLVAIHMAAQSLLNGECDMALAGGVTIELPHRHGYLYQEGEILSPDGHCRAFDADSQGTVFGSAVGVVVLRRLTDALADGDHIHAVIRGSAINNDGSGKVGYLAPSVDGQAQAIAEALAIADVPVDSISYVETHGTGTPVGDPIEIAALTQAFRRETDRVGFCGIGSVKCNIGHTDTAAGVASFIKVALAMQHRELPPSLHFQSPNPACELERSPFYVNATLKPWAAQSSTPLRAGVSSLGVGGTNAHVVLEQAPPAYDTKTAARAHEVMVLSARTTTALDAGTQALADHLARDHESSLADVAHTLQIGRQPMKHRRVVVGCSVADAAAALAARDPNRMFTVETADLPRGVVFMFAGGGAQYPAMGADLYRDEAVFRGAVDECLAILARRGLPNIAPLLFPGLESEPAAARELERPSLALPALMTIQYAQAKLWRSWGITPVAMIGHSMGEYTAAHLAGVFSLEDALTLVELRGRLFESLPEGAMLSVPLSEAELLPLLGPEVTIAVVNGPKMTVASGPVHAIDALEKRLLEMEVEAARIRINVAAHSPMLEPILPVFGEFLRGISMKAPAQPFVSNLSGTWITAAEATDPAYWVRHLRQTVRFADGLQELLKTSTQVLLEVGPGRTLASLARMHPGRAPAQPVFSSLRHPDEKVNDQAFVLGVLGKLWAVGVPVDWALLRGSERRLRVELPTYRFDHQRHWIEPGQSAHADAGEVGLHRRTDVGEWFYEPVWNHARLPGDVTSVSPNGVHALVFADAAGLGERLAARLRALGTDVCLVRPGKAFGQRSPDDLTIDPSASGDYDRMIAALASAGRAPQQIYHLWSVTAEQRIDSGVAGAGELQRLGFFSLLYLAQAIGREDLSEPITMLVVSDRMQRVTSETERLPAKATLLGACKVVPREFPTIRCRSIDIELPASGTAMESKLLDGLLSEAVAADAGDVVAYRAGQRWLQNYAPLRLPRPATAPGPLRPQGVYMITGGLGGVGLALAAHLALTVQARLVLVGRTGLPPRGEWESWLKQSRPDHAASRRMRQVMALEARGAEVMLGVADVTSVPQLREVVKQARKRFGTIHGVLHTAGVLNDGVIALKDAASAAAVLAPKLQGTLALEAALKAELRGAALDFVVLFSSISSFIGLAGQIDYAAANSFLDAYAQDRYTRDGTPTYSVNWSQWQEVGMAASLAQQLGIAQGEGADGDTAVVGHPLVQRCISDGAAERVYETTFSVATHWLLDEHRVRGGEALIPGTGYLEMVRAAHAHHREARTLELRDVTFLAPFVVRAGEERALRVRIQGGAGVLPATFVVTSRSAAGADSQDNVRGSLTYVDVVAPSPLDIAAISARCQVRTQVFTGNEAAVHLLFGPRWSNLRRIDYGHGEALAQLELPAPFAADLVHYELHPALMDMATAGAQALIVGYDELRDFFVPASYGVVRVFSPLPSRILSHIRCRSDAALDDGLAVFDVTVFDERGRVLVDIESFTMIRLDERALSFATTAAAAVTARTGSTRARATANNVLSVGLRDGIRSAEGADALERILAAGAAPQVVVSPQSLKGLLAQLREPPPAAQGGATTVDDADWLAPQTVTEKLIAQMWGEMLGAERVGTNDDFFDLGGHSLLAVQMINKLRRKTGKVLPLTALLEAPTVGALAALIDPNKDAVGDPDAAALPAVASARPRTLVLIRPGLDDRIPIFFVHDGLGETLLYRNLALQLEPGRAVFGIQPEVNPSGVYAQTRITDWAAAHVRALRTVQPTGPYLLAGLCAGGVIAFEMARQLQDVGESTLYVGIIDAADTQAKQRAFRIGRERVSRLLHSIRGSGVSPVQGFSRALSTVALKVVSAAKYEVRVRLRRRAEARTVRDLRQSGDVDQSMPRHVSQVMQYLPLYEHAHREHVPHGLFNGGQVFLYRATEDDGTPGDQPYVHQFVDPLFGWGARVVGEVHAVDIPGGHSSALQEPQVLVLARAMNQHISQATAHLNESTGVRDLAHAASRQTTAPCAADDPVEAKRLPAEV